jgi:hypothetical protein
MRKMTDRERMQNYLPEHREAWRKAMQENNDRLIQENKMKPLNDDAAGAARDAELIAELRRQVVHVDDDQFPYKEPDELCHRAADRIAALTAEREQMADSIKILQYHNSILRERAEKAEAEVAPLLHEQRQPPEEHPKPAEADGVLEGQRDSGEEKTDQRDNHKDEGS